MLKHLLLITLTGYAFSKRDSSECGVTKKCLYFPEGCSLSDNNCILFTYSYVSFIVRIRQKNIQVYILIKYLCLSSFIFYSFTFVLNLLNIFSCFSQNKKSVLNYKLQSLSQIVVSIAY